MSETDKKTDVWMPLWIGAYLADTMHLTTVQHGAYLLLLMAYWRERSPLPDDDDALRSIAKADKSEWKKLRPVLSKFFKVGSGVWWHKRVEEEMQAANARQLASAKKAKAAAQARWGNGSKDAPSNAPSMLQALPEHMHEECPTPSPTPIGIPTDVVNSKTSVCVPPHTQFSEEFRTAIRTARPELDAELVWANFCGHYAEEKRTLSKWQQWVKNERAPRSEGSTAPSVSDPDSRASVEAEAQRKGMAPWDQVSEQWHVFKARVRGVPVEVPTVRKSGFASIGATMEAS